VGPWSFSCSGNQAVGGQNVCARIVGARCLHCALEAGTAGARSARARFLLLPRVPLHPFTLDERCCGARHMGGPVAAHGPPLLAKACVHDASQGA